MHLPRVLHLFAPINPHRIDKAPRPSAMKLFPYSAILLALTAAAVLLAPVLLGRAFTTIELVVGVSVVAAIMTGLQLVARRRAMQRREEMRHSALW